MIELSEFKIKCNKGHCLRQTFKSKQCMKEIKQESCYDKFIKKMYEVKLREVDDDFEWKALKESIHIRDNGQCRFYQIATKEERDILDRIIVGNTKIQVLDGAHVIARSKCPEMIMDEDNVYLLSRYVHSCIDNYIDPLTRKNMTWDDSQKYWIRIIGEQKYNELYERYRTIQNNIRMGK